MLAQRKGRLRERVGRHQGERQSALLIAVPEVDPLIRSLGVPPAGNGLPPHVTVLYPFLPPPTLGPSVDEALARLLGAHRAFDFALTGLGTFPGVVWLAPEPDQPFLDLGDSVIAEWPDLARYGGAYPSEVAHLTVARGRVRRSWRATVAAAVPIRARATEVLLMVEGPSGNWSLLRRFALSGLGGSDVLQGG